MKRCANCGQPIIYLVVVGWVHVDLPSWLDCPEAVEKP